MRSDAHDDAEHSPESVPAYTIRDVASYLQLPPATVRAWVVGMNYRGSGGTRRFQPVIRPADAKGPLLSFENLIEVHVLSSLRREHELRLEAVRRAVEYLRRETGSQHPLAQLDLLTDGTSIFVDRYGRLINASREGQAAMRVVLEKYLHRVKRGPDGRAIRLYPITRVGVDVATAPTLVAIDPRQRFGHPFVVACGVETRVIAGRVKAGDTVDDLVKDYRVSREAIEEAIRYELPAVA